MPRVIVYSGMFCPYCASAMRLLKTKGVEFEEIDVSYAPEKRREMVEKSGGRTSVPQIWIGDTHVGGCEDLFALEDDERLDALLEQPTDPQ